MVGRLIGAAICRRLDMGAGTKSGTVAVVTIAVSDNGIMGFFDVEPSGLYRDAITISASRPGGNAFRQARDFAAVHDVLVIAPGSARRFVVHSPNHLA